MIVLALPNGTFVARRVCSGFSDQVFVLVGAVGFEPTNPSLVSVGLLAGNQAHYGSGLRKHVQ